MVCVSLKYLKRNIGKTVCSETTANKYGEVEVLCYVKAFKSRTHNFNGIVKVNSAAPHNKCVQIDSARVVNLCAARCAPFVAHKWPTHALRLTQALYQKNDLEKLWQSI